MHEERLEYHIDVHEKRPNKRALGIVSGANRGNSGI